MSLGRRRGERPSGRGSNGEKGRRGRIGDGTGGRRWEEHGAQRRWDGAGGRGLQVKTLNRSVRRGAGGNGVKKAKAEGLLWEEVLAWTCKEKREGGRTRELAMTEGEETGGGEGASPGGRAWWGVSPDD